MSEYLIKEDKLITLADAVREKTGKTNKYSFDDMVTEIRNMSVNINKTPILDESYPQDMPVDAVGTSVSFNVVIEEDGYPVGYTYQWYYDGAAVSGATSPTYTRNAERGTHTVYCIVTNEAGFVTSRTATVTALKVYLFKDGDQMSALTGGWTTVSGSNGAYSTGCPSFSLGDTSMTARTNDSIGFLRHKTAIDLTPYTTVHFTGSASDHSGYTGLGNCTPTIMPTSSTNVQNKLTSRALSSFGSFTDFQVDITTINQQAYVCWWFYDWGSMSANGSVTLTQVWLT